MSDNKPTVEPKNVTMYPHQWKAVQDLAAREYEGNISFAMRRIIDQWLAMKADNGNSHDNGQE